MTGSRCLFTGSGCAMVTPFTKENTIDNAALREQAAFQLENGSDALIVCGTTGEPSTMTDREQAEVIRMVVETANGRVPVIAGVGGNNTAKVIEACRAARELGADGALAVTPYYNKTTQPGLVAHYEAVADASPLPVILYNVPARTGLNMKPQTAEKLSHHPNIVGLKEASGDITQVSEIARLCGDRLPLYSGGDEYVLPLLGLGSKGVISVLANIAPKKMHQLCSRYFDGAHREARDIQLSFLPLIEALFMETSPSPVKAAMEMMGFSVGAPRLPLIPMSNEGRAVLRARLEEAGLIQ